MTVLLPLLLLLAINGALSVSAARANPEVQLLNTASNVYLRHCYYQLYGCNLESGNDDFNFLQVPALNGAANAVSFQSINYPDQYITLVTNAEQGRLGIAAPGDVNDASFQVVAGLANSSQSSLVSLSKGSFAGAYLTLSGSLQGACASGYKSPESDAVLDKSPASAAAATFLIKLPPPAPPVSLTVQAGNITHQPTKLIMGCHSDSGYTHQARGFYTQMIFGESFENIPTGAGEPKPWNGYVDPTAKAQIVADSSTKFHGSVSQKIQYTSGSGVAGLVNRGLGNEGLVFEGGQPYEGYFFATSPSPVNLRIMLRDYVNHQVIASQDIYFAGGNWTKLNFTVKTNESTTCSDGSNDPNIDCGNYKVVSHICIKCNGEFFVGLTSVGTVNIDFVYLQPGDWARFAGLPVWASTVETLKTIGTTAIRQGGSFTDPAYYFWKNWRGVPWERPSIGATWQEAIISGWGPFEMIDMCNAAGIEPIITTTAEATGCCDPSDMADLIEYCWGDSITTQWGRVRAADGHPQPYKVKFFELGNEQYNSKFAEQVKAMEERAIALGMPNFFVYLDPDQGGWLHPADAAIISSLGLGANVAEDFHVGGGGAVEGAKGLFDKYPDQTMGACNAETNAGIHTISRALMEADDILDWLSCSAPWCKRLWFRTASFCTERSGHYDAFDQGITFFLPNMTWIQPPGYVHQMISNTWQPNGVSVSSPCTGSQCRASAELSDDGKTLALRYVNHSPSTQDVTIALQGFTASSQVTVLQISGQLGDANPPGNPTLISPTSVTQPLPAGNTFTVPGNSFTVFTFTSA